MNKHEKKFALFLLYGIIFIVIGFYQLWLDGDSSTLLFYIALGLGVVFLSVAYVENVKSKRSKKENE